MNNLRYYRKQRGLTQGELEALSGVDRSTISQIEKGKRNATQGTMLKLSKALKKKPEDIFFNKIVAQSNDALANSN